MPVLPERGWVMEASIHGREPAFTSLVRQTAGRVRFVSNARPAGFGE